jgi:hypothetical protein
MGGGGGRREAGGDGLVPQVASDNDADEKWLGELRAVAHALLKGIKITLDKDSDAVNNVFATEDNFHVSHNGKRSDDMQPAPTDVKISEFEQRYLPSNGQPPEQVRLALFTSFCSRNTSRRQPVSP